MYQSERNLETKDIKSIISEFSLRFSLFFHIKLYDFKRYLKRQMDYFNDMFKAVLLFLLLFFFTC